MSRPDVTEALLVFVAEALREADAHVEMSDRKNSVPPGVLRVVVDDWQFDITIGNVDVVT
jgi:hypothetical protein